MDKKCHSINDFTKLYSLFIKNNLSNLKSLTNLLDKNKKDLEERIYLSGDILGRTKEKYYPRKGILLTSLNLYRNSNWSKLTAHTGKSESKDLDIFYVKDSGENHSF